MLRKKSLIIGTVVAGALLPTAAFAAPAPTVKTFHVTAVGKPKGAYAKATITISTKTNKVCTLVVTKGLVGITAAHIHTGKVGTTGPVAVPLLISEFNKGKESCVVAPPAILKDILARPAGYYFNVHTAKYPAGAVRAQL
ncbi:MAG: CHRD domain-containing protein [Acidimicrobiales bacterium]